MLLWIIVYELRHWPYGIYLVSWIIQVWINSVVLNMYFFLNGIMFPMKAWHCIGILFLNQLWRPWWHVNSELFVLYLGNLEGCYNVYEVFENISKVWECNFVIILVWMYTKCLFESIFEKKCEVWKVFWLIGASNKVLFTYSEWSYLVIFLLL